MSYLVWKLIHLIFVIAFLGNITTGLFWAAYAHKTRDFQFIGKIFKGITKSDRIFTIPGVVGIVAAGIFAAAKGGFSLLRTGWIVWPIILFTISGILFMWLAPLQSKIGKYVDENAYSEENWKTYNSMYRKWDLLGILAILTPFAAMVIMVLKPEF